MSNPQQLSGTCLCKAVSVRFTPDKMHFDACHCGMCRKWGSGPLFSVDFHGEPQIDGMPNVTVFESSDWGERGFCSKCGTHIFWCMRKKLFYNFSLGLLYGNDKLKFEQQIFIDHKPDNYAFANKTKTLTEAEVFAKYIQ